MRKVLLNMKQQEQYEIIKNLIAKNGNKLKASIKLNCTIRTINRLIKKYKSLGKPGFIHGNTNKKPKNTIDEKVKEQIINLYQTKYKNFNFKHYQELLIENENINYSYNLIYTVLTNNNIYSPKLQRSTKHQIKMNKKVHTEVHQIVPKTKQIPPHLAHPRKERSKYFGEQLQMDASQHMWFGNFKTHLHLAIDDTTSKIVGAYFTKEETLEGYYTVLHQILIAYGIPYAIKTDNRTIFAYKQKRYPSERKDTFTQFKYACIQLGIELSTTSIPQNKGRVERCFGTLQSRLTNELRLANVQTIDEANQFLEKFIIKFNDCFSLQLNNSKSVFEQQPNSQRINEILATLSSRLIDSGASIKFKNKIYQPYSKGKLITFANKTPCLVIEAFNKELYVSIEEKVYELRQINIHKKYSSNFDLDNNAKKEKTKYVPSINHPWKIDSWNTYRNTSKGR